MGYYHPHRSTIIEWLGTVDVAALTGKTRRVLWEWSYPTWARNAAAWDRQLGTGGTYTMRAIMWYQHVYKPGSTDSRPGIILNAISKTLNLT